MENGTGSISGSRAGSSTASAIAANPMRLPDSRSPLVSAEAAGAFRCCPGALPGTGSEVGMEAARVRRTGITLLQ